VQTRPSPPSVTRVKVMQLEAAGVGRYRLVANLTDTSLNGDYGRQPEPDAVSRMVIHDFVVEGELLGPDLVITRLDARANTHPYRQCPAIIPSCQALVGRSLAKEWRRAVLDTLGATAGCTHMTTLLLGLAEARTMAFFLQMNDLVAYSNETRADGRWTATGLAVAPTIADACHVLTSSGSVIRQAQAGNAKGNDAS
jgi:hypothetical protein